MHAGSEPGNTEAYMMFGAGSLPNLTIIPPPEGIELMNNEPPSEYIFDPGLSYPAPDNFGYLPTGYEPPGDWGEHHSIYGLDGQDLHYMGLQAESMPYIYYTPGYGYAQAPFNQYSSYIPGVVPGLEGTLAGVQPYVNIPSYQPTTNASAYVPVVVQSSSDLVGASYNYPLLVGNGASIASGLDNAGAKIAPLLISAGTTTSSQLASLVTPFVISGTSQPSQRNQAAANPSEGLQISIPSSNQSLLHETQMHRAGTLEHQGVSSSQMQLTYQFSHERIPLVQTRVNFAAHSNSGLTDAAPAPSALGWSNQEKGNQIRDTPSYMIRNPDSLGEQNSGPRRNRLRDQSISSVVETAELNQNSASDAQEGNIFISPDNYNKDDFPVDYPDAKFFVIKSYSEDDVHKSVKYNVWSSTHNGNRRLDSAYAEAQRIGKSRKCPVLLFFSVNASGQFCGVAEMDGPVDFDRDMNFWQQDKWSGSFPVKWHIIKDVSNANLRHIILENNENKPVTNSRDTQEIPYSAGINMLKVFKTSLLRTSILDDFMFYEDRQKKMLEDKFRRHGRIYDASIYVPAHVSQNMPDGKAEASNVDDSQPSGTRQITHEVVRHIDAKSEQSSKNKEKMPDDTILKPSRRDGKQLCVVADQSLRTDGKQPNAVGFASNADWRLSTDIKVLVPKENGVLLCSMVQFPKDESVLNSSTNHPPKCDEKQSSQTMNQLQKEGTRSPSPEMPSKVDEKQSKWIVSQPPSSDESTYRTKDVNSVCKAGSCGEQFKSKIHAPECSSNEDSQSELDGKQLKWRISRPPSSDGSTDRLQDVNGVGKANSGGEQLKNKICASESSSNRDNRLEIDEKQRKWKISWPPSSDGSINRPKDVNGVCKAGFSEERLKNIVHSSESSSNKDTQSPLDGKQSKWRIRPPLTDGSTNKPKDVNGVCKTGSAEEQLRNRMHASESSSNKDAQSEDKLGMHSLYPNKDAAISLAYLTEFVTIGSMQIKVNGLGESSRVSGAGTVPSESNGPKLGKKGALTNS